MRCMLPKDGLVQQSFVLSKSMLCAAYVSLRAKSNACITLCNIADIIPVFLGTVVVSRGPLQGKHAYLALNVT